MFSLKISPVCTVLMLQIKKRKSEEKMSQEVPEISYTVVTITYLFSYRHAFNICWHY